MNNRNRHGLRMAKPHIWFDGRVWHCATLMTEGISFHGWRAAYRVWQFWYERNGH